MRLFIDLPKEESGEKSHFNKSPYSLHPLHFRVL